jgi:hypothetical protein
MLSDLTPRATVVHPPPAGANSLHPSSAEHNLKTKKSPPSSLHSSFAEGSDLDQVDEPAPLPASETQDKEKRKRWRLSRRKEDLSPPRQPSGQFSPSSPRRKLGSNSNADISTSTVGSGSGQKPRRSFTGESTDPTLQSGDGASFNDSASKEGKDDGKGLAGWIKNKVREHNLKKENKENDKRNRSPAADRPLSIAGSSSMGSGTLYPSRGKSFELMRPKPEEETSPTEDPVKPAQAAPETS